LREPASSLISVDRCLIDAEVPPRGTDREAAQIFPGLSGMMLDERNETGHFKYPS